MSSSVLLVPSARRTNAGSSNVATPSLSLPLPGAAAAALSLPLPQPSSNIAAEPLSTGDDDDDDDLWQSSEDAGEDNGLEQEEDAGLWGDDSGIDLSSDTTSDEGSKSPQSPAPSTGLVLPVGKGSTVEAPRSGLVLPTGRSSAVQTTSTGLTLPVGRGATVETTRCGLVLPTGRSSPLQTTNSGLMLPVGRGNVFPVPVDNDENMPPGTVNLARICPPPALPRSTGSQASPLAPLPLTQEVFSQAGPSTSSSASKSPKRARPEEEPTSDPQDAPAQPKKKKKSGAEYRAARKAKEQALEAWRARRDAGKTGEELGPEPKLAAKRPRKGQKQEEEEPRPVWNPSKESKLTGPGKFVTEID
ncbi:unnamed protein product [Sympodiomycopsis kandeliae]